MGDTPGTFFVSQQQRIVSHWDWRVSREERVNPPTPSQPDSEREEDEIFIHADLMVQPLCQISKHRLQWVGSQRLQLVEAQQQFDVNGMVGPGGQAPLSA